MQDRCWCPIVHERTESEVKVTHSPSSGWGKIYDIHLNGDIVLPFTHLVLAPGLGCKFYSSS